MSLSRLWVAAALPLLLGCPSKPDVYQAATPISQSKPRYPILDWDATPPPPGLKASVLVDTTGRIVEVTWVEGAELLQREAEISFLKWRFDPATLGGKVIEDVYILEADMTPPETVERRAAPVPKLLHRVQPTFSGLRKSGDINRQEAIMRISIDEKGLVKKSEWISGPEALKVHYLKAVKKWRYEAVSIPEGKTHYVFDQHLVYRFD